jgi:hypothetical protein
MNFLITYLQLGLDITSNFLYAALQLVKHTLPFCKLLAVLQCSQSFLEEVAKQLVSNLKQTFHSYCLPALLIKYFNNSACLFQTSEKSNDCTNYYSLHTSIHIMVHGSILINIDCLRVYLCARVCGKGILCLLHNLPKLLLDT